MSDKGTVSPKEKEATEKRGRGRPRKQPQEPSGSPTPKRPRGRPKGSKNKTTGKGKVSQCCPLSCLFFCMMSNDFSNTSTERRPCQARRCSVRLAARAELQRVCVSAQFHQLSLSLRPGGQRTGVPCVQFLSAFQIIANEPNAPFPSVSIQRHYCHLQAASGRALWRYGLLIPQKATAAPSAGGKRRGRPKK
ncbi:hypothetical protein L3Q82_015941, partial [Scortum barcoo]